MNPVDASVNEAVKAKAAPVRRRAPRAKPNLPVVALCAPEDAVDMVLVLRLPGKADPTRTRFYPGKRYSLASDGSVARLPSNGAGWFSATGYAIDGVDALQEACERARTGRDGGPGYLVAGDMAPGADPRSLPRSKKSAAARRDDDGRVVKRGHPVGLVDAARHWIVADLDHVPAGGIDPRQDPRAALARLRSLLPPAMACARTGWQWSSSTCLKAGDGMPLRGACPDAVGAHLRFMCDTAMDEPTRKEIQARLDAYVSERCPTATVDTATAIYNQAVYCSVSLEDGLRDPFPGGSRAGMLDGVPVVNLADLLAQMPVLPGKAPISPERKAALSEARKAARAARKGHDALLKGAARQKARPDHPVVLRPAFVRRDPLRGAYGRGKAERIAWRQQQFRERALADIVKLVSSRRSSDPAWADGVPDGKRRRTMLAVTALVSWLAPADRIAHEVSLYAARLVSPEWFREVWLREGWGDYIVAKAREAAKGPQGPSSTAREDRCKPALMNLLSPTEDEQVGLGLAALRNEMARSTARRAAAGVETDAERRERQAATSARSRKPWEALGISQSTYYRTKRAEAAASPAPAQESGFTAAGLSLIAATLDAADHAAPDVVAEALAGFGLAEIAEAGVSGRDLGHAVMRRGDTQPPARKDRLHAFGSSLFSLATSLHDGTEMSDSVRYLLDHSAIDVAGRGSGNGRKRVATRADLLALAAMHATAKSFAAVVRLWGITGERPSIIHPEPIAPDPEAILLTGTGPAAWAPEVAVAPPFPDEMPSPAAFVPDPGDPFGGAVPW